MTYKKFLGKYDVLQLSEYKKIIAEDKHFIALKIWEDSYDENKSIYRTFKKNVYYHISDYIVRIDNMIRVSPDNHFIESKSLVMIDSTILSPLYYTDKDRGAKSLIIYIDMLNSKEIAQRIEINKTSKYIKNKIIKDKI